MKNLNSVFAAYLAGWGGGTKPLPAREPQCMRLGSTALVACNTW